MKRSWRRILPGLAVCWLLVVPLAAGIDELGRNDVRIYSAAVEVRVGESVIDLALPGRLGQLGYDRVHRRPQRPGEFFWGHEVFWVFSRSRADAQGPGLVGLDLRRQDGVILGRRDVPALDVGEAVLTLERVLLAEEFSSRQAARIPLRFADLPERVWRPLLAAEDARFFDHQGVDGRAIARALLANVRAGKVAQGGSTITQQLVKMRDLTPARSLGRKVSEAVRALHLEAGYDKVDILEEYLNHVYLGHVEGLSLYGYGAAARAFFDARAEDLSLAQATLLAAIVQAPNRFSPVRNAGAVADRYRWILDRLEQLGWAAGEELRLARRAVPGLDVQPPRRAISQPVLSWLEEDFTRVAPRRAEEERGVMVETTLDPWLQRLAEQVVDEHLSSLRASTGAGVQLQAAMVAVEAGSGKVVAYVGGGSDGGALDRVRSAQRQPGSTVKPLVLAEAFADCGRRAPLYPAARISNAAWSVDLPSGRWMPRNPDGGLGGVVTLRQATVASLNVPFARLADWCGFDAVAARMRDAGLELANDPPPSFVLGAIEVTPLALAAAYTALVGDGQRAEPLAWESMRRPSGRLLAEQRQRLDRVLPDAVSFLVRDVLRQGVVDGTSRGADVPGIRVFAKTGTSSGERDAWAAGGYADLCVVVWIGRDDGTSIGLSGGGAAAPLLGAFLRQAVRVPDSVDVVPDSIELRSYDPASGLLVRSGRRGARDDYFVADSLPPRRRWWRPGRTVEVIE